MSNQKRVEELDSIELAVMANRMEAIVSEMTNIVVLTARSSVIGLARDMSCAIVTADSQLLAAAESIPIHIYATTLQSRSMHNNHPDFKEGDAFLHNDPYDGGTHPADHALIVPVFYEGEHVASVTTCCHQADVGNSIPTTYMATAKDVYEEGALIFPCVRIQEHYKDNKDIVRMCERRIRIPENWYGDYLAAIGAARTGEKRIKEFIEQYGLDTFKTFIRQWFDYSETMTRQAIRERYESGTTTASVRHDPVPVVLPEGLEIKATYVIDAEKGHITVDQRDNPDCIDGGLNLTEATATMGSVQGVFNCLGNVPYNSGALRCIDVLLREGCCVGLPIHPHSCSCATNPTVDLLVNMAQVAFSQLGEGMAEGNWTNSCGAAVLSGRDPRRGDRSFVDQIFLMGGGGPATARTDGMNYYLIPPGGGLLYRDSVEIDEQNIPFLIETIDIIQDTCGAGKYRGGPGTQVIYRPRFEELTAINITNGKESKPRGVHGGSDSTTGFSQVLFKDSTEETQPAFMMVTLKPGDKLRGVDQGGGGYGDPLQRDPVRVYQDVEEGYISAKAALEVYGVVLTGALEDDNLGFDVAATEKERAARSAA